MYVRTIFWKDGCFFLQMLNEKYIRLLRLACIQFHSKQLVCYFFEHVVDVILWKFVKVVYGYDI